MANVNQNVGIGFSLAVLTAVMWGLVPIAMKQLFSNMSPYTIVWYRFAISAICLLIYLACRKKLPSLKAISRPRWLVILFIAVIGLAGNFVFFSTALQYLTPTTSQVIGQLSPIGMMLASVFVLKEKMRSTQIIGSLILIVGLLLFFNKSLFEIFTQLSDFTWGIIFGVTAAIVWVAYGVAQKILLRRLGAQQILLLLYIFSVVLVLPFSNLSEILKLTTWQWICLIFCGLNTVIGYGALAEAMSRWQAAQVSAVITFTPLFTLVFTDILSVLWPKLFNAEVMNVLGYIGAFMVVAGAMFSAIGHRLMSKKKETQLTIPTKN